MAQAYLLDTNYTRPPDLSNLSSIPSDDTQIIPEDESLKDTTSQSLSNTHSQIILEDSQIIPGLFHDYSLPVSQPLSQPPSLPDSETLSQIIPDSLSVSPEEEPAEVSQYNPEEETIPEHEFEIKTTIGMAGAMKGKTREKVSLIIENYIFRKRYTNKNGTIVFSCNGCELQSTTLFAVAKMDEDGKYELLDWPRSNDHCCWADVTQALIRKARNQMFDKVREDPSRSIPQIYETVRSSFTQDMSPEKKSQFLLKFPLYRNMSAHLYTKRREQIPADPKLMTDFNIDLEMFLYKGEESVCIGDVVLSGGRRILLFSSDAHLKILAKAQQILVDGTFRITPSLWTQTFIISAQVTSNVFVPVVFALLPDKKRESYDAMFSSLKENLTARGLELSARYLMSGKYHSTLSHFCYKYLFF